MARAGTYELLVDWMLPHQDDHTLVRRLRAEGVLTPVPVGPSLLAVLCPCL